MEQREELFKNKNIDLFETKKNFEVFLLAYKSSRGQNGLNTIPAHNEDMTLKDEVPPTKKLILKGKQQEINQHFLNKYLELDSLFRLAYENIHHKRPTKLIRRKRIFLKRYFYCDSLVELQDKEKLGEELISKECKETMLQFCKTLGILVMRERKGKG